MLAAWGVGGAFTLAGAIAYAELAAMLPRAGGEMWFLRSAYGRGLAFLYGWMQILVGKSGSQAALAVALAIFVNDALGGALSPAASSGVALAAIAAATAINLATVRSNGALAIALTLVKMSMIGALAFAAFVAWQGGVADAAPLAAGGAQACADVPASARGGFAGFGAAVIGALWGYSAWGNLTLLGSELKDPGRNFPRALILAVGSIVALYGLANAAYFVALTPAEVMAIPPSSSVARELAVRALGPLAAAAMQDAALASRYRTQLLLHVNANPSQLGEESLAKAVALEESELSLSYGC